MALVQHRTVICSTTRQWNQLLLKLTDQALCYPYIADISA